VTVGQSLTIAPSQTGSSNGPVPSAPTSATATTATGGSTSLSPSSKSSALTLSEKARVGLQVGIIFTLMVAGSGILLV
jgi:hypothetical protein